MSIRPYKPLEGRVVHTRFHYPVRDVPRPGVFASCDIPVAHSRGLRAKLIVFKRQRNMRAFWHRHIGIDLGAGCCGVTTEIARTIVSFGPKAEKTTSYVDSTYFALIGLCIGHLNMEVICHESCHAGLHYAERQRRRIFSLPDENDSEEVCYPTGRIASAINEFLHEAGAYDAQEKSR